MPSRRVCPPDPSHHIRHSLRSVHGGVLCDLADAAMGMAFVTTLAPDESFTTVELSINFFPLVWQTVLRAEGRVINRGRNVGYVECDVTDQEGKHVEKARSRDDTRTRRLRAKSHHMVAANGD